MDTIIIDVNSSMDGCFIVAVSLALQANTCLTQQVSSISQYRCKLKSLLTLIATFQSLWNKKEEFETFVFDNDSFRFRTLQISYRFRTS